MLTALRGATGGIVAKAFLVLLAGSFAVWGVADVFRGGADTTLAKVGKTEISARQFRAYFDNRINDLARSTGRGITVEDARRAGIDRQILAEMLRSGALDDLTSRLNMSVSPEFVAQRIASSPRFQNTAGQFNPENIRRMLAQRGISEQQFLDQEKKALIRSAITNNVRHGMTVPQTLLEIVYRQINEQRDVKYFTVSSEGITAGEPDDKQLKAFYERNRARFAVPERRGFDIITVKAADLAKDIPVSEEQIKALYEKRKRAFEVPEKRTIEQIAFANMEEAKKALRKIREGTSFTDLARQKKMTDADRILGTFTKADTPDPTIADAAFSLELNKVSEPVKGKLAVYLLRVTKIQPASKKTLQEVRSELTRMIRAEAGRDLILQLRDKVEDARGAGTPFNEIAKDLKLDFRSLPPVDRNGLDKDGKEIKGVDGWEQVRKAGFESAPGIENDPVATPDDGFVWFNVREVIPAHIQKLKEVRDRAVKLWQQEQIRKKVLAKAEELKKQAENGTPFEELAKSVNAEIKTIQGIKRNEANAGFGTAAVQALFKTAPDGYAVAVGGDGKSALVIKSTPVLAPPFDPKSPEAQKLARTLAGFIQNDTYVNFMARLQTEAGVEINDKAWASAFQTRTTP